MIPNYYSKYAQSHICFIHSMTLRFEFAGAFAFATIKLYIYENVS